MLVTSSSRHSSLWSIAVDGHASEYRQGRPTSRLSLALRTAPHSPGFDDASYAHEDYGCNAEDLLLQVGGVFYNEWKGTDKEKLMLAELDALQLEDVKGNTKRRTHIEKRTRPKIYEGKTRPNPSQYPSITGSLSKNQILNNSGASSLHKVHNSGRLSLFLNRSFASMLYSDIYESFIKNGEVTLGGTAEVRQLFSPAFISQLEAWVRVRGSNTKSTGQKNNGGKSTSDAASEVIHNTLSLSSDPHKIPRKASRGGQEDEESSDESVTRFRPDIGIGKEELPKKFACPFFKKEPWKYQQVRACPGPGWPTVHRVKEHVYRNHSLPISCPRCHQIFETDALKDDHIRAEKRCKAKEGAELDGISLVQKQLLKSRKRGRAKPTELEKWKSMYMIIFPETDKACIPSPYYDYTEHEQYKSEGTVRKACADSDLNRYEQFLRLDLPMPFRQQLELLIEERLHPANQQVRDGMIDIFREMQLQLLETYKASTSTDDSSRLAASLSCTTTSARELSRVGDTLILGSSVQEDRPVDSTSFNLDDFFLDRYGFMDSHIGLPVDLMESHSWYRNVDMPGEENTTQEVENSG